MTTIEKPLTGFPEPNGHEMQAAAAAAEFLAVLEAELEKNRIDEVPEMALEKPPTPPKR